MYDADKPILSNIDDRLNRSTFAKTLARCLLNQDSSESLSIGLFGAMGSGKTSLINLMLEELKFASNNMLDEEKPIVLNFNAWSYSGQNQLIYSFFRRLSSTLRRDPYFKSDLIVELLELYVSFFTRQSVPETLKKSNWRKWFKGSKETYGWHSGQDLTLVKSRLNEELKKQKHRIIIIIDNIARLDDKEIKQIIQIVKSIGDYSNTTYLLALEKKKVIHAINRIDGGSGEELLEKTVQMTFNIPPILKNDLDSLLAFRLAPLFKLIPEDTWNAEDWTTLYYNGLKYFFKNCRDITRYVNNLSFSYPHVREIVNPVDFFVLTAIEVFMPRIFNAIRDNKDLFTDLLDQVYQMDQALIDEDKMRCEEILSRSDRLAREQLLQLLIQLFPRLRKIYQADISFYHSESIARKLKRICSPDLFDAYFRLSLRASQIPHSEFKVLINLAANPIIFDQLLTRLNQDEQIIKFLDQLDNQLLTQIPEENIGAFITALLDNGDLFPERIKNPLAIDTPSRIHRIIQTLLVRIKDTNKRYLILNNAMSNISKSIYVPTLEIRTLAEEHHEESDTYLPIEYRLLNPKSLTALKEIAATNIKHWAEDNRLDSHPKLMDLLIVWFDWGNKQSCQAFVQSLTSQDKGLVLFLVSAFEKAINEAMSRYEKNRTWFSQLENINQLIPAQQLVKRATAIFEDNYFERLCEKEQLAVLIFLDLMKVNDKKFIPSTSG